jgi:hypothetical protein
MDFSSASKKERQKVQTLVNALSKRLVNRPSKIELQNDNESTVAEIVKRYDQGIVKYFLIKPAETIKAAYLESLWEKELYKWNWSSEELNIEP